MDDDEKERVYFELKKYLYISSCTNEDDEGDG